MPARMLSPQLMPVGRSPAYAGVKGSIILSSVIHFILLADKGNFNKISVFVFVFHFVVSYLVSSAI
jgi:hypothetical protein